MKNAQLIKIKINIMQQRITHIEAQKAKAVQLKTQVCKLLGCNEEQYCQYQYKEGRMFLQSYISRSPSEIDEILATRAYWAWWRNHWMQRDECFIAMGAESLIGLSRKNLYSTLNDYRGLLHEIHPSKQVLEMDYTDMMDKVIREIQTNENAG